MRGVLLLATLLSSGCGLEPGFMQTTPRWSAEEHPLLVCVSGYVDAPDVGLVSRAIGTMNDRLGFKVYALAETEGQCVVSMTLGVPSERGWTDPGGNALIMPDGARVRCSIETSNTGTKEILFYVVEHELGHCLGLAHDDWRGSIMRRVQTPTPDGQFGPWISDHDRRIVREQFNVH